MDLDLEALDKVVDTYAEARKSEGQQKAFEKLRFTVYSRVERGEAGETFRQIGCVARTYAKICRLMSRPRCGIEIPLVLSTICFCFGCIFFTSRIAGGAESEELHNLWAIMIGNGIFLVLHIIREIARKWCDFLVLAAIYDELAECAGQETA